MVDSRGKMVLSSLAKIYATVSELILKYRDACIGGNHFMYKVLCIAILISSVLEIGVVLKKCILGF